MKNIQEFQVVLCSKFVQQKIKTRTVLAAHCHLIVISQALIYMTDKLQIRIRPCKIFAGLVYIVQLVKNNCIRFISITTCPARLLVVGLHIIVESKMNDRPYIRFVNTHTKRICSHYHPHLPAFPFILHLNTIEIGKTCMIIP